MQATTQPVGGNLVALVVLGILEAVIVIAAFTNVQLPLISNNRIALIVFIVIGMAMCGMGMQIPQYGWTNPFNLVGIIVGIAILVIATAAFFGVRLPLVADERAAILMIAALIAVKVAIAGVRGIVS